MTRLPFIHYVQMATLSFCVGVVSGVAARAFGWL